MSTSVPSFTGCLGQPDQLAMRKFPAVISSPKQGLMPIPCYKDTTTASDYTLWQCSRSTPGRRYGSETHSPLPAFLCAEIKMGGLPVLARYFPKPAFLSLADQFGGEECFVYSKTIWSLASFLLTGEKLIIWGATGQHWSLGSFSLWWWPAADGGQASCELWWQLFLCLCPAKVGSQVSCPSHLPHLSHASAYYICEK